MRREYLFIALLFLFISAPFSGLSAQKIEYIKIPDLERILKSSEDKLFVVNFWATWCPPCVKELPHFEKVARDYDTTKVKFLLISLDFPSQIDKQLIPFLKKNRITLDVSVMMDVDYNSWIDMVDKSWQGNIPATLFFNNSEKLSFFQSEEIDESQLRKLITSFL